MTSSLDGLIIGLQRLRLIIYIDVASFSLWAYDYMLTLDQEISFIWATPWNFPKALFLLTRYLPISDSTAIMYFFFHPGSSDATCYILFQIAECMFTSSSLFRDVCDQCRVCWINPHDTIVGGLGKGSKASDRATNFLRFSIVRTVYVECYLKFLKFTQLPNPTLPGCFVAGRSSTRTSVVLPRLINRCFWNSIIAWSIKTVKALKYLSR